MHAHCMLRSFFLSDINKMEIILALKIAACALLLTGVVVYMAWSLTPDDSVLPGINITKSILSDNFLSDDKEKQKLLAYISLSFSVVAFFSSVIILNLF